MLDRRRNHFSFQEIAHHWAREPNQRYSSDEILTDLVVAFWRGDFSDDEISWDANYWLLKSSDGDYPPKPLPDKYQKFQGERLSDFEPISRNEAFEILIACGDQYAKELIGCSDADTFDALAHKSIEDYGEAGRLLAESLNLTKRKLKIWSENRGVEAPRFSGSTRPPKSAADKTHQSSRPVSDPVSRQGTAGAIQTKREHSKTERERLEDEWAEKIEPLRQQCGSYEKAAKLLQPEYPRYKASTIDRGAGRSRSR